MKVGKQFNTLTYGEYLHLIKQHKKYTDFNTLGLFRSILEAHKLSLDQKCALRQIARAAFPKSFDFLQLKDPLTYFELTNLGETLTAADEQQSWVTIRRNQQQLLAHKKLNHRNFGTYSKHLCGHDFCPLDGMMLRQGSGLAYPLPIPKRKSMAFPTDKNRTGLESKSARRKQERKVAQEFIAQELARDVSVELQSPGSPAS
jgi:hypothetical protein